MPRDTLQIGGEGIAPTPRSKPAIRKATSPYTPANRNPLTGEIIRIPGHDDEEEGQQARNALAITPSKSTKPVESNGVVAVFGGGGGGGGGSKSQTNGQVQNNHTEKNNIGVNSNGHDIREDLSRIQISDKGSSSSHQQQKLVTGKSDGSVAAQQLYEKYVRKGESDNALHHRIRLDDQFTNVLKSLLPERITELCHNQIDMTMAAYNDDKTCAKLPFIARLVTTRLPHVCDDIVGCLFVRGGRVPHSAGGGTGRRVGEATHMDNSKSASKPHTTTDQQQQASLTDGLGLFFYKTLSGKRAPLLQPFVSCAPLCHVTGWKKGSVIGLSDLYVGAEFTAEPREALKQQQLVAHGKKKQQMYHQDSAAAAQQHEKGQLTLSALATELLEADRYLTLKVMWLDDTIQQQCASNVGKPLAVGWAGADLSSNVERIRRVFGVRDKIAQQLRNIPSWKTVCFDIFGRLISRCLAALQNTEINTRDAGENDGGDGSPSRSKDALASAAHAAAAMTTMTKQQVLNIFGETSSTEGESDRLVLDDEDVDTIFEHLLPLRADGADAVNTLHLADFIAFSWTSEHETWLLRKAYRKLDPSCTGVVSFKTLEGFTCARNATLTTHKGVREISSFTGLGSEVKDMFDEFISGLKHRSPNGITYYDLACFINTLAVNDGWKQPENDMDRANLIAWSIKRLFTVDD